MNLKNIIYVLALLVVVLMVIPSVYGYTFGRGSMHDMETSDYVLHPEKDKIMTLEDMQRVIGTYGDSYISNNILSPEEEMLFPEEKPVNMHDFAGYGSVFGTPQSGLHDIGPHLGNIGPHFTHDQFGGWGEPQSVGACGHFYGLGVI